MLSNTHHIAIIASDYQKAKEFYVEKLGFELFREVYRPEVPDHLWMLRQGNVVLELFIKPNAPQRVTQPEALGLRHLAFHVEDAPAVAAWLNSRGIEPTEIRVDPINGGRYAFFRDPDGLPLEIHE